MPEIKINTEQLAKVDTKAPVQTFKIMDENHPTLFEVIPEFNFAVPPVDPNAFASSLVETCKENKGLGLAANQCGFKHRVFVMGAGDQYVAHFNPKILGISDHMTHMPEGCLSFPFLALMITRPTSVQVEYYDFNGERHEVTYTGISARTFQHELDHLNGIVYTQRAKPLALKSGVNKRNKTIKEISRNMLNMKKMAKNGNSKRSSRNTMAPVARG